MEKPFLLSEYTFNASSDCLYKPFYGPYGNNVPEDFGLTPPCSADEFHRRWSMTSMKNGGEQREAFLRAASCRELCAAWERGERRVEFGYTITDRRGLNRQVRTVCRLSEAEGPRGVEVHMENYQVG